jgi:energy-coupling factor transport system permease protein
MNVFKAAVIGQYIPGDSPLHRLDARTKLLALAVYVGALFAAANWPGQMVLALFMALALVLARLPLLSLARGLRPVVWLVAITLILNALMTPGPVAYRLLGFITFTRPGVDFGLQMSVRLLLLFVASSLLTVTTPPVELTDGMESVLGPFRRLGVPAHDIAMMMTIALRFIPTLMAETERIMRAQSARGADFEHGSLTRRLGALVPLLVPLFVSAFRRADELATAMEARAYRGGQGRTRWRRRRLGAGDAAAAVLTLALVAAVVLLRP